VEEGKRVGDVRERIVGAGRHLHRLHVLVDVPVRSAALLMLAACAAPPAATPPVAPVPLEVAVTVDDLPLHGPDFVGIDRLALADRILAALRAHHVPEVYGFVNGARVEAHPESVDVLRHWRAAGYPLGNHTYSHVSLNDADAETYLADLERDERLLSSLDPDPTRWKVFRYPYLFEGNTLDKYDAVHAYLASHGYRVAEVSIDGDDWAWNPPYARCRDAHDDAALETLRAGYIKTQVDELRFMRDTTRQLAGRDIVHILLLHLGAEDAEAIDLLLTAFEQEGVRWVPLSKALADPFYSTDRRVAWRAGAAFPYAVAKTRGRTLGPTPRRDAEDALDATCASPKPH
jgi:peptidoglycan-N-acetylglucosamine deacetylase